MGVDGLYKRDFSDELGDLVGRFGNINFIKSYHLNFSYENYFCVLNCLIIKLNIEFCSHLFLQGSHNSSLSPCCPNGLLGYLHSVWWKNRNWTWHACRRVFIFLSIMVHKTYKLSFKTRPVRFFFSQSQEEPQGKLLLNNHVSDCLSHRYLGYYIRNHGKLLCYTD